MHELSLALNVCRIVEEAVGPDQLGSVRQVGLEVGERSGVEVANLEFCLEAVLSTPPFSRARATVARTPGHDLRVTWLEVEDDGPPD